MHRSTLKEYVSELLREDLKGFVDNTWDQLSYFANGTTTNFRRGHAEDDGGQDKWQKSRTVKQVWHDQADHQFFKGLTKVHWFSDREGTGRLDYRLKWILEPGAGKNELSTTLYTPGDLISSPWGRVGVEVQGFTTIAANDMDAIYTGYSVRADNTEFHKNSGVPKRPGSFSSHRAKNYILDKFSFDGNWDNEGVIDNWKPVAIRVLRSEGGWRPDYRQMLKNAADMYGLQIIDENGNVLYGK